MAKINSCLKCLFIFFNVLFAVVGVVILGFTIKFTVLVHQDEHMAGFPGLIWSWLFSFAVIGLSSLGVYGGSSEKRVPLIIFAVFMGLAVVVMVGLGIQTLVAIAQVRNLLKDSYEASAILEQITQISLGVYFGTAAVALLGLLLSGLMVHQVRRREDVLEAFVPMKTTEGGPALMNNY